MKAITNPLRRVLPGELMHVQLTVADSRAEWIHSWMLSCGSGGGRKGGMTPSLLPTTPYEVEQKGSLTYEELHPVSGATCQSVSPAAS